MKLTKEHIDTLGVLVSVISHACHFGVDAVDHQFVSAYMDALAHLQEHGLAEAIPNDFYRIKWDAVQALSETSGE